MKLRLADHLTLPVDAVTQTMAIVAKRRVGKSYLMRKLVEQLHHAGQQVCLVDPKGDQWGLRSSADGRGPGLPIIILGGERGDVPLEVGAGEVVAKLIVEERVSTLLDLSGFRKREVAVFMAAFLEALYRLKAREVYRTPMMLVVDEADAIAPQKPQPGEERMLGAIEDIVRRGGQRGIGCALVTQRTAVLNKNVLTQAQILVALRTIAPQDLKAMKDWIDVHGDEEQRKTLMASLPSLPVGDAWFWSPGWPTGDGIFQRVHVLPIETFDSGATPKPGERRAEPRKAADVDLEALKRQMADTIEKAKADDPRELRKELAAKDRELKRLQVEASQQARNIPSAMPENTDERQATSTPVLTDADRALLADLGAAIRGIAGELGAKAGGFLAGIEARVEDVIAAAVEDVFTRARTEGERVHEQARAAFEKRLDSKGLAKVLEKLDRVAAPAGHVVSNATESGRSVKQSPLPRASMPARASRGMAPKSVDRPPSGDSPLDGAQQKILNVVAMLGARGITPTRETVARWLDIHPNGGRYGSNLAYLRANGYLDGLTLTDAGAALAQPMDTGLAGAKQPLDGGQVTILNLLDETRPQTYTRETLAAALGIHPNGGRYGSNLARLRVMGLIPERGAICLTEAADR